MAAVSAVAESPSSLAVAARTEHSVAVLTVDGVLDAGNSAALRDSIIKATLQEPSAVIVNVTALQVPAKSAWSAFIGVRWQFETRPDVPIVLVCANRAAREAISPQRGRPLHAGVLDRESGDQGDRPARPIARSGVPTPSCPRT